MFVKMKYRLGEEIGRRFVRAFILAMSVAIAAISPGVAQDSSSADQSGVLSKEQWQQVDESVQRGLEWLASQQQPDGSFPTLPNGQPAVTSLCVMAFLANGHVPGEGPYGQQLEQAIDFVISCQKRNGLLALTAPNSVEIPRNVNHEIGLASVYNHAISGLLLSEAYAMVGPEQTKLIGPVVTKSLNATLRMQEWRKDRKVDLGGWRYLDDNDSEDSDLSVTGWHLMFLRSAKNAGFDVPQAPIDAAVGYVRRCFRQDYGTFTYKIVPEDRTSRAMAGAGVLALAHSGLHNTTEAQAAGNWLLKNGFDVYNRGRPSGRRSRNDERYHYGLLTACQAMYQLGGDHWRQFFPPTARVIVANQQASGCWLRENHNRDGRFGETYTSALALLALSAPNQLLPIFQR